MTLEIVGNLLRQLLDKVWPLGAGANEAHIAPENIENLWYLVNAGFADKVPDSRYSRIIFLRPLWDTVQFGVHPHTSEFQEQKRLTAQSQAFLTVKYRALAF